MGLRGLRPCTSPRRSPAWGPPGDACGIVVAPVGARCSLRPLNTGLTRRAGGVVWGGAIAPRVEAPARATAASSVASQAWGTGSTTGIHGATPHTPSPLTSRVGGVPSLAVQAMTGRATPSRGSGGAAPCRGAAIGGGRDACWFRAQRLTKRFRAAKHSAVLSFAKHPPNCSFSCQKVLA